MKKLTEFDNFENEEFKTPAEALDETARKDMTAGELIDDWVETYLSRNGMPKGKRQYEPEAGTSIQTVLNKFGYEIIRKGDRGTSMYVK